MGRANASYLDAVLDMLPEGVVTGRKAMACLETAGTISVRGMSALKRYSESERPGQEDGRALNAALASGGTQHEGWAQDMDEAFVWTFSRDVLLWRGYASSLRHDGPSPCYISATLVERQARQFRSRAGGGGALAAILLPAGARVAAPLLAWGEDDGERTRTVMRHEAEIVLPRGSSLEPKITLRPLGQASRAEVTVCHAEVPEPSAGPAFR